MKIFISTPLVSPETPYSLAFTFVLFSVVAWSSAFGPTCGANIIEYFVNYLDNFNGVTNRFVYSPVRLDSVIGCMTIPAKRDNLMCTSIGFVFQIKQMMVIYVLLGSADRARISVNL